MGIKVYALNFGNVLSELSSLYAENTFDAVSQKLPIGVYSTFRTCAHCQRVLGLQAHLDRIYKPAEKLGIEPSVLKSELRSGLKKVLEPYQSSEGRIRICMSLTEQPGQVVVMTDQLKLLDEEVYRNGVKVVTISMERDTPRIKSSLFIQKSNQERKSLEEQHIFEALMVKNGKILEGITSNFYALKNSRIITARNRILLGVTRRIVLRLLKRNNIEIEYRPLRIDELTGLDEAFISSSSRGVVPVIDIDGTQVGQGKPGNLSVLLRNEYDNYVSENSEII